MARKILTKNTQRNLSSCLTSVYAGWVASTFFCHGGPITTQWVSQEDRTRTDVSPYVHRKNREHEKHGSGADDQGRIETYTYEMLNWDSGLAGEIYSVCEEIFEKHLTVLMFTMLYIYSYPPVDVQSVCLDVFESVENKNSPCKRGDLIFGQKPYLLLATHKCVSCWPASHATVIYNP